jgi:hypothetical protein
MTHEINREGNISSIIGVGLMAAVGYIGFKKAGIIGAVLAIILYVGIRMKLEQ